MVFNSSRKLGPCRHLADLDLDLGSRGLRRRLVVGVSGDAPGGCCPKREARQRRRHRRRGEWGGDGEARRGIWTPSGALFLPVQSTCQLPKQGGPFFSGPRGAWGGLDPRFILMKLNINRPLVEAQGPKPILVPSQYRRLLKSTLHPWFVCFACLRCV